MNYHSLSYYDVAIASLLIVVNLALSLGFRLGLARSLMVASIRMVVQLLLVGYALEWIFSLEQPAPVLAMALLMATVAGVTAVQHTGYRFAGVYWDSLVAILSASFLVTGYSVVGVLRLTPWYEAQYVIPLFGMVLGNAMTGVSLALDRFLQGLKTHRSQIETLLALGATAGEAVHSEIKEALRIGMVPTINSMLVTGIVSLPGMMTGQVLAGASPVDAVRYQIVIIFMLAAATALAVFIVLLLAFRRLFDGQCRLRLDRVTRAKNQ
jgi:putative ABC transport system permease protein